MNDFHNKQSTINHKLFYEANRYIPGGVNSPVRSFKAVGGWPVFVKQGKGSKIYGECGGEFIDFCLSWGALLVGHAHPEVTEAVIRAVKNGTSFGTATKLETRLARIITEAMPSIEKVRLTNSGTEAVMSAVRLARAYTGKNKILKFNGSYHGHADYLLGKAGSGQATLGATESLGVPEDFTRHTISLKFNDTRAVKEAVEKYRDDVAAIIVEPVAANYGVTLPDQDFLQSLREITSESGILLIFDEVITGFRLAFGGAEEYFGVTPDLACLGKIIGGGFPAGAFGGKKEIMELVAPLGGVYQAGTLSGNPVGVTAGITTLEILKAKKPYAELEKKTGRLCDGMKEIAENYDFNARINRAGSIFNLFFGNDIKTQDTKVFRKFFHGLLKSGIYFSPSGFEANFLSTAHSEEDIDTALQLIKEVFKKIRNEEVR